MLVSQVGSVLKQALTTFTGKPELFYQNLELLKTLLEKTTIEDVNLNPDFLTDALWQRPGKAPVTYIDIYENTKVDEVSMGIFILKPGMKLPLHNHPQMHGLIKVIYGTLRITSYSLNTEKTRLVDAKKPVPRFAKFLTAELNDELIVDAGTGCCTLEPEQQNLHEIESLGGPAAFVDILAPPYKETGDRKCSYFKILHEMEPSVFRLREIPPPTSYWTDSFPYTGPNLY